MSTKKNVGDLRRPRRVSSSCSTSGIRPVTLVWIKYVTISLFTNSDYLIGIFKLLFFLHLTSRKDSKFSMK
jgi:hypothetical protein